MQKKPNIESCSVRFVGGWGV